MKIIVISDSHGNIEAVRRAVAVTGPDLILHLGDHDKDCEILRTNYPQIPLRAVRGNCDPGSKELDVDEFVIEGKRFFMTHGHKYGVKLSRSSIIRAAKERGADIILYGHTHEPFYCVFDNMYIINPGSIGLMRKTYSVIDISGDAVTHELKDAEIVESTICSKK